ncbi:hypothetical protein [Nioella aestuarii]|uniref:hypothetical protein n=1 Tax=Nioella aestuarii TaxID=1662864 RepID=UPI003D7F717A
MTKFILATLLALSAAPVLAQSATGANNYVANPGIPNADTGPRYCPELADTEHPFRIRCPSWPEPTNVSIFGSIETRVGQGVVGENPGVLVEDGRQLGSAYRNPAEEDDQD